MVLPEFLEVQFGWIERYSYPAGLTSQFPRTIDPQYHSDMVYRIRLVNSGHIELNTDQYCWQLTAGSVMLLPPIDRESHYNVKAIQDSQFLVAAFRLLLFGSIDMAHIFHQPVVWHPEPKEYDILATFMQVLLRIPEKPSFAESMMRDGAIRTIFGLCWDTMGANHVLTGNHPQVPEWLNLVIQELRHYPGMTVTELERLTGYGHTQFCHLFQQYVGIPPRAYLQRYRADVAKNLLMTTEMNIAAISEHLGFVNAADFTRFFRRMCMTTPTEYRRSMSFMNADRSY